MALISMAVMQASPSPCAKWASPAESSAPGTKTGNSRRDPLVSCLASTLPQFSRGGIVRAPSAAILGSLGTASSASGSMARPPRATRSVSRRVHSASSSREGARPAVPMKLPSGMRTPGSFAEVAQPSLMSHCTP